MKIDFVITWVDGNDPKWLEEKNKYVETNVNDVQRFRDWELLKYWFRGVEQFAPWVNKIHFITWGHVPDFLDTNHPKINIVKHEDYLDAAYRPTFNSNAIELSMHKIDGLSEHFVYFNDDMYLLKGVKQNDFFENGLPKDVAILNPIVGKYDGSISNVMLNNMSIVNQHFSLRKAFKHNPGQWLNLKYGRLLPLNILFQPWSSAVGLYQQHLPTSFVKETFNELWEKEFKAFDETSKRKLRNNKLDINQWLIKKWHVMSGQFSVRNVNFGKYIMVNNIDDVDRFKKVVGDKKTKMVCLNDHATDDLDRIIPKLQSTFELIVPEKCSFEK